MDEKEKAIRTLMEASKTDEIRHNWLYSFLPVGDLSRPFLVGFCKDCRTAFSQEIPYIPDTFEFKSFTTEIPKYGCQPI